MEPKKAHAPSHPPVASKKPDPKPRGKQPAIPTSTTKPNTVTSAIATNKRTSITAPTTVPSSTASFKAAYLSKTGMSPEAPKKVNQDSLFAISNFLDLPNSHLFGVCDGHGQFGKELSSFIKDRLPILLSNDKTLFLNPKHSISSALETIQVEIVRHKFDASFSGSTLNMVLMHEGLVYCANVGDSRAVVGAKDRKKWVAVGLSRDHKPDLPEEKIRIEAYGGRVEAYLDDEGKPYGPPRVWIRNLDYPGIAMSRSIGDSVAASIGVIAMPEITEHHITPMDRMIVLGSDGLFEFINNEEIINVAAGSWKNKSPELACQALVRLADERWKKEEESIDDITCICVFFNFDAEA